MDTLVFTFQNIEKKLNQGGILINVTKEEQIRQRLLYRNEIESLYYFVIKDNKIYLKNLKKSYDKFKKIENTKELNSIIQKIRNNESIDEIDI